MNSNFCLFFSEILPNYSLEQYVYVTLILEVLLLLGNPVIKKKSPIKVQIMRETWHVQELKITPKSLGLIWKGVTFNNLKRLLLKP